MMSRVLATRASGACLPDRDRWTLGGEQRRGGGGGGGGVSVPAARAFAVSAWARVPDAFVRHVCGRGYAVERAWIFGSGAALLIEATTSLTAMMFEDVCVSAFAWRSCRYWS